MCSKKHCRLPGDFIAVADRKQGTYHLCQRCWEMVTKMSGSIQVALSKLATPIKEN